MPGDGEHEGVACRGVGAGVGMGAAVVVPTQPTAPAGQLQGEPVAPVGVVVLGQFGWRAGGVVVIGAAAFRV